MSDVMSWRELALDVEQLFGAPMATNEEWNARLNRHIDRGTAWCARIGSGTTMVGGMWLSYTHPDAITIAWLAVQYGARRLGVGSALVEKALTEADGQPVRVVTFGHGHPSGDDAEASRRMYRSLGFTPSTETPPDAPDDAPREVFWHDGKS